MQWKLEKMRSGIGAGRPWLECWVGLDFRNLCDGFDLVECMAELDIVVIEYAWSLPVRLSIALETFVGLSVELVL